MPDALVTLSTAAEIARLWRWRVGIGSKVRGKPISSERVKTSLCWRFR